MEDGAILCLGELVWDSFPDGYRLGGAPFNVAIHLARHGSAVELLTAVGQDALGDESLTFLQAEGVPGALRHPSLPTGTVAVELGPGGVPSFSIHDHCAWLDLAGAHAPETPWLGASFAPSILVFGALAMHSAKNRCVLTEILREMASRGMPSPTRICDLNLRPRWTDPEVVGWCALQSDILKVNEEELLFLAPEGPDPERLLLDRFDLQGLCITRGSAGLAWLDASGQRLSLPAWSEREGAPRILDTVGAGDAVTAAIALGMSHREPPLEFLERGRRWAAHTCGSPGALPPRESGEAIPCEG